MQINENEECFNENKEWNNAILERLAVDKNNYVN